VLCCDDKESVANTTLGSQRAISSVSPYKKRLLTKSLTSPVQPMFEIPFPTVSLSLVITQLPLSFTPFSSSM
jgi:hypothetical protein